MSTLKVFLNYSHSESTHSNAQFKAPLALPFRVLDAEGGLIAEGVTSGVSPGVVTLPDNDGPWFVRLTWPSGKSQTKRIKDGSSAMYEVHFSDDSISQNEWSAWAVPRLNERSKLAEQSPSEAPPSLDRFRRAWIRLWKFEAATWTVVDLNSTARYSNDHAKQIDFELSPGAWCLQIGGANVPWRFVSLPGGGSCRVLITPKDSTDPRADPLKVVVTSFRSDAETLLEFLQRDSLRAAKAMANFQPLAARLLAEKVEDPISAVAGAYFLLRTDGWSSVPISWFENLSRMFPLVPDGAILYCVVTLRAGLSEQSTEFGARELLAESLKRGLPIFAEGLSLLSEAASLLRLNETRRPGDVYAVIDQLSASQAWAGASFSFYGVTPDSPSPDRIFGIPGKNPISAQQIPRASNGKFQSSSANDQGAVSEGVSSIADSNIGELSPNLNPQFSTPKYARAGAGAPQKPLIFLDKI